MKTRDFGMIMALFAVSSSAFGSDPYQADSLSPRKIPGYKLVWNDEFNYRGAPDTSSWKHENGFVRNEELQWYQPENASCSDGLLHIKAIREKRPNPRYKEDGKNWRNRQYIEYTSASINTRGLHSWLYGRFEIRAKIPAVNGSWPAIWTLGDSQEWPSCGEIDLMEFYDNSILANAAWGTETRFKANWNSTKTPLSHFTDKDSDWVNKFHVWRMDWTPEFIKLYLDDELLNTVDLNVTVNANGTNPFKQTHYILLNLAIGGMNGGDPGQTEFPLIYDVDYVRVYQKSSKAK